VSGDEIEQIRTILNDSNCYKGNRIQQLKGQLDSLQERIDEKVQQTRAQAEASLKTMQKRMQSMDEYQTLPEPRQDELNKPFRDLFDYIWQEHLIAVIKDRTRYFEEEGYQKLLGKMVALANQRSAPSDDSQQPPGRQGDGENGGWSHQVKESAADYVHTRNLRVTFDKAWLADEGDVDRYLSALREALLAEVQQGRKVQI